MSEQSFILGVNYWPRRKAMTWWKDFDSAEVREEFAIIANLGMRMVRIFLLWEDWQPTPDTVSESCLENLGTVCDIAADLGLQLDVTFFTGHMSGPNWAPEWMLLRDQPKPDRVRQVVSNGKVVDCAYRNQFNDPLCLDAERLLLRKVVARFKEHPGIGMWNLGNEPDLFAWPDTHEEGRAWVAEMTALIKSIDPAHPVTCGLHVASLNQDNGLWIGDVFNEVDVAVMHGYPMYTQWSQGNLDPWFVPFMCAFTSAFCDKPTLAEEFGGCTAAPGNESQVWAWQAYGKSRTQFMASEEAFAAYLEQVLQNLVKVGSSGAMLWCFADYAPELWSKPPCDHALHERFFGLVRPDGSLKPHTEVIRKFAATNPTVQPAQYPVEISLPQEEFYRFPQKHVAHVYANWVNKIAVT